jgi:hypothetical protein
MKHKKSEVTKMESVAFPTREAANAEYQRLREEGALHVVRFTTHLSSTVRREFPVKVWNNETKQIEEKQVERDVVVYDPRIIYVVAWQEKISLTLNPEPAKVGIEEASDVKQ